MLNLSKKKNRFRMIVPAYPAFNIYSRVSNETTALGPLCVASVVNKIKNWDAEVIDENNFRLYGPRNDLGQPDHEFLQKLRPADVVGLYGGLTSTIPRLYEVARFYKKKGAITIAGGQHFVAETILEAFDSCVDYIVLGEGEETIRELLVALEDKQDINKVNGIAYRSNGKVIYTQPRDPITDFDKLPLPDFALVRHAKIKVYPVERIRGCGMDCEFCTVKGKPRFASPERLLESISKLVETKEARHFFVVDDLFGQQRNETIRFCQMLKEYKERTRRLDLFVQIRLDKASDSELLSAMRQAGINTVAIGFESPIKEELEAMNKRVKPEDMISLARIFHKFGFLVHGMFIFGYPLKGEGKFIMPLAERIKRFKKFISKAKIDTIQVLIAGPLPGTELRQRLKEQGRVYLVQDIGWQYYDGNFPLFEPDEPLTAQELQLASRKIMGNFYNIRHMFKIFLNILSFPGLIFFMHNISSGWRKWYRPWRNSLARFGGWIIIKRWTKEFKKSAFPEKLKKAQDYLKNIKDE
ncbi:MAG: B12-binding domain-containing radical SAM protein [Candidatus Omnitrophica bacterium]|nr:B12-binding domain-containing radical SAM protein [Candidatus Omnitrophota bacterium]